ncbi:hypothetical protein V1477_011686 [Vespula maculifrons]|uniref:Uncharacterized protein n=1 Tax=Vespula maculifrons TaxID=7453 RepID=A0ABD2BZX1_VESMC
MTASFIRTDFSESSIAKVKQNQLSAQHHENMQIIFFWIPSLKLALKCICKWPKNVHRIIKIIMNDYINNSSWSMRRQTKWTESGGKRLA